MNNGASQDRTSAMPPKTRKRSSSKIPVPTRGWTQPPFLKELGIKPKSFAPSPKAATPKTSDSNKTSVSLAKTALPRCSRKDSYEADDEATSMGVCAPKKPTTAQLPTASGETPFSARTAELIALAKAQKSVKTSSASDVPPTTLTPMKAQEISFNPASDIVKFKPQTAAVKCVAETDAPPPAAKENAAKAEDLSRKFKISAQLAHGSPTHIIDGFTNIAELYQKIADAFNIKPSEIIFCTVNTVKNDMDKLFCGQLDESDLLFVHVGGQAVELTLTKTEGCIGLSISDNGFCRTFVKRIKPGTICDRATPAMSVGQQIVKIDGECVLGRRHYEVAKILRNIPINKTFTVRFVSPLVSGFSMLLPRGAAATTSAKKTHHVEDGLKTLRFKGNGKMVVEEAPTDRALLQKLDAVLDEYLGVQDEQLAHSLLDVVLPCSTLQQLSEVIKQSELQMFEFPDELVFDVWGIVGDWKKNEQ